MKGIISIVASVLLTASFTFASNPTAGIIAEEVKIKSSKIKWTGYKVTGKHYGSIDLASGSLDFDNGMLTGGEFVIDMQSLVVEDLSGNSKGKLEGHLKSDDFFGVETHPTAKFVITKAVPYGTEGAYKITGDLTIKGITKPIKFMANLSDKAGSKTVTAEVEVDRSEYNVRYGSGSFFDNLGDKTIYDEFKLEIELALAEA